MWLNAGEVTQESKKASTFFFLGRRSRSPVERDLNPCCYTNDLHADRKKVACETVCAQAEMILLSVPNHITKHPYALALN